MQGVVIQDFISFDQVVIGMNLLGDLINLLICKVFDIVYEQMLWDNLLMFNVGLKQVKMGVLGWFKQLFVCQMLLQVNVNVDVGGIVEVGVILMGLVGKEFLGLVCVVVMCDDKLLLCGYMDLFFKVCMCFNQIKNQGDLGLGVWQLMQQILDGNGLELVDMFKYVDEQMLIGMIDSECVMLCLLLVCLLLQLYVVVICLVMIEVNKVWNVQVYQLFVIMLVDKYLFVFNVKIEVSVVEIGQVFGLDGVIVKFVSMMIGLLLVCCGDMIVFCIWGDLGIVFVLEFIMGFMCWIVLFMGGVVGGVGGVVVVVLQMVFQILLVLL